MTCAGQLQALEGGRLVGQQLALDVARHGQLALERIPFPEDAVGRLDLAAHPVVGAEGRGDPRGEQRVEREEQQHGAELGQQEQRIGQQDGERPEPGARQHEQLIERQAQPAGQPRQQR